MESKSTNSPSEIPKELAIQQVVVPIAVTLAFSRVEADSKPQVFPKKNKSPG
jgi:hypothetical protein